MKNKDAIRQTSLDFLSESSASVILGGHFSLVHETPGSDILVPGIFEDCKNKKTSDWVKKHPYMSHFPTETFSITAELVKKTVGAKVLLLANDWQHVEKTTQPKSEARKEFYRASEIPPSFAKRAMKQELNLVSKVFNPPPEMTYHHSYFFSETILRNKFDNHARYKSCSLKNGCAQEFMPLFDACEKKGFERMVAFIPATCAYPVMQAVGEFKNIYNGRMKIMSIFISDSMDMSKFWNTASVFVNGE